MSDNSTRNGPRFGRGDRVRVKAGVKDPDNPDLPIGRWCGIVDEVEDQDTLSYLVRWDQRTRDGMHPVYLRRCEHEGLETDTMWLDETDLEPDDGTNLPLEQPTTIVARPLDPEDPEDRIRAVFGLTGDDALPELDAGTLLQYHAHLSLRLRFPFEGEWYEERGPQGIRGHTVTVLSLRPPEEIDLDEGILCTVRMRGLERVLPLADVEIDEDSSQGRLVEDYGYWFDNWSDGPPVRSFPPGDAGAGFPEAAGELTAPTIPLRRILNGAGILGAICGGTLGAALGALDGALKWMLIGAAVFAVLIGLLGRRYGIIVGAVNRSRSAPAVGGMVGVLIGALFGSMLGVMAVAIVGSLAGSIIGVLLADLVVRTGPKGGAKFLLGMTGACVGTILVAVSEDREKALAGLLMGALIGIAALLFLVVAALLTLAFLLGRGR